MKLPEDKKERLKLYVLFGIAGVAVLWIAGTQAIKPMLARRAKWRQEIAERTDDLRTTRTVLDFVEKSQTANRAVVAEITRIAETSNFVLRARLGNFLLEATERIEARAAAAGVPVTAIKEVGVTEGHAPGGTQAPPAFSLYTVRIETRCGMHDLIRLLREIEETNPYACVGSTAIRGQSGSPAEHAIGFDISWPIWKDEGKLNELKATADMPRRPDPAQPPGEDL